MLRNPVKRRRRRSQRKSGEQQDKTDHVHELIGRRELIEAPFQHSRELEAEQDLDHQHNHAPFIKGVFDALIKGVAGQRPVHRNAFQSR